MRSQAKFILSKSIALEKYDEAKDIADLVTYSFKSNRDVGYILRDSTDSEFSIHATESIPQLGCPKRTWFFSQAWDEEELREIIGSGIRKFVIDNEMDLNLFLDFIEKEDIENITLLLRMRLKENTVRTGKHFVFGMYSSQIIELIPKLKENKRIAKLGIHFHRKTQNISEWNLKFELENIFDQQMFDMIDYLNIGGGLPSMYKNYRANVIENIFNKIKELKQWLNSNDIKLIIEPGRYIAAPAIKLQTKIKNIYGNNIIVDSSVYAGCMDTFVSHIRLDVEDELLDGEGQPYTIKGKTPCSIDIFRYRVWLDSPKLGDTITFLNAGAYNYWTDFCGLEKIPVEIVD